MKILFNLMALIGMMISFVQPVPVRAQEGGSLAEKYYFALVFLTTPAELSTLYDLQVDIANLRPMDGKYGLDFEAGTAVVYITDADAERLRQAGLGVMRLPGLNRPADWPIFDQFVIRMQTIAANYPDLVRMVSIGKSVQNRDIWCLKITDNPDTAEDEPEIRFSAALHGNEATGIEMTLRLAELLTSSYATDPAKARLVNEMEIWICPISNPDGYVVDTRYNVNGVDLNRNFPEATGSPGVPPAGSQPETQAFMNFTSEHHFMMGANYHGGTAVVNYPWDANHGVVNTCAPSPDEDVFNSFSRGYAILNPDMLGSGFINGVTLGCDWYEIHGGLQDYAYAWFGEHHVTIEVSTIYAPAFSSMDSYWSHNRDAMLWWMERALMGARGKVTDAISEAPLSATVARVRSEDYPVRTDPVVGDYHRVLLPGTYSLRAAAPCYISQTAQVTVGSGDAAVLDFPMERVNDLTISGVISDAVSGSPLAGTVELVELSWAVNSDPGNGAYGLPACFGAYTLRASAPWHIPEERMLILSGAAVEDFKLEPYQLVFFPWVGNQ